MKSAEAELLANSLSTEQRESLRIVRGKALSSPPQALEAGPLIILMELGLVRQEQMAEREFLELTQKGKKVADFV